MRIVLILDSFKRDGLTILNLCKILNRKENKPYIKEIFICQTGADISRISLSIKKTIVIHNYSRDTNKWLISKLKSCGVFNYVLDTEGCPLWIFSPIGLESNVLMKEIDGYFAWGDYQLHKLKSFFPLANIIKCGSFRHQRLKKLNHKGDNTCLVLTSSPGVNPKFINKKEAWKIFKNGIKDLNKEEIISVAEEQKKIAKRICDLLKIIPDMFEKIIIRVHPLESQKIYNEATSMRKNIIFSSEVDIFQDLKAANTVVHGYSTAGLEAVLCGKKVFCIEKSPNIPLWLSQYFELVSLGSKIINIHNIDYFNTNNENFYSNEVKKKIDYFYGTDLNENESLEIIKETLLKKILTKTKILPLKIAKRILFYTLLQIRKIVGRSPLPNKNKLITKESLHRFLIFNDIDIKFKEVGEQSGIWKISRN